MIKYYVYILKSINFEKHYIGQTKDLKVRLEFHNSSKARWTKRFQPWKLAYTEEFATRSGSMRRETELKKIKNIKQFLDIR